VYMGVVNWWPEVDLVLFNCLKNLPMLGVSFPPTKVPTWNADEEYKALQLVFGFEKHLQDDGCMIVFHSWCTNSKGNVVGLCDTYSMFKINEVDGK